MGKIYADSDKSKIYWESDKIKQVYWESNKIYSSGNVVTYFVDADKIYQEEVEEGASCLQPITFIPQKEGWEFVGWRNDLISGGDVLGEKVMGDDPLSLYAIFKNNITLTYHISGNIESEIDSRYYNNGAVSNPRFTIQDPVISGATFRGWSISDQSSNISYSSVDSTEFSSDTEIYAVVTYSNATLKSDTSSYQFEVYSHEVKTHNVLTGIDGRKYGSLQVTVNTELTSAWWATNCSCNSCLGVYAGGVLFSSVYLRSKYTQNGEDYQMEHEGYPCFGGATATVTLDLNPNDASQTLSVIYNGDIRYGSTNISEAVAIGKTVIG